MVKIVGKENQHEDVYGKSFALYDHDAMKEFINFHDQRFEINGLDPASIFAGKKCLDAGCGNGRGALFMLANGASSVDCVDISQTNIDSTSRNIDQFGFGNYSCHLNSLESLPFPDNTFDFVWCNGVVMHTHNPDKCISELSRVLKNGGKAWIYVYGSGGLYWYCVQRFRKITKDIAPNFCISLLRLLGYSSRYVGEYLDDWKVPYLRTYTQTDFSSRMKELGFKEPNPLLFGVSFDTSHRRNKYPEDAIYVGEGDLRYLTEKDSQAVSVTDSHEISSSEYGSDYDFPKALVEKFSPLFDRLEKAIVFNGGDSRFFALAACSRIQFNLRNLMTEERAFPVEEVAKVIVETCELLEGLKDL